LNPGQLEDDCDDGDFLVICWWKGGDLLVKFR